MMSRTSTLWWLMQVFQADALIHLAYIFGTIHNIEGEQVSLTPGPPILSDAQAKNMLAHLDQIDSYLINGLPMASRQLGRVRNVLVSGRSVEDFRVQAELLQKYLMDEAQTAYFVPLSAARAKYVLELKPDGIGPIPHPFGEGVTTAFGNEAQYNIQEAGKCLTFERGTATVFHLMKALEVVLHRLADTLHDPRIDASTNRSWEMILKKFDEELAKPEAKRSPEWQRDSVFFADIAARLRAVKDAWRNPTMHVEGRYDVEQATEIWDYIKAFMQRVAKGL